MNCLLCNKNDWSLLIDQSRNEGSDKNYICNNCGFIGIHPRPNVTFHNNEYKDGNFSTSARGMDKPSKYMTRISDWQANNRINILEKFTDKLAHKKVLDIGCGAGNFMKAIRDLYNCEVTGLEPDSTFTESAKQEFNLDIRNEFLEDFISDDKFDLVCSFHVIEHVADPNIFLQKCKDLLADDGLLYLECPSIDRIYGDTVDYFFWYAHLNTFSAKTLSAFFAKNGFEILTQGWNKDFINIIARKSKVDIDYTLYYDNNTKAIFKRVKNYNSLIKPKIRKMLRNLRVIKNKIKKLLFNID